MPIKVVPALAGGRLYPEAATLALSWGLQGDKAIHDIIIYGRPFCESASSCFALPLSSPMKAVTCLI